MKRLLLSLLLTSLSFIFVFGQSNNVYLSTGIGYDSGIFLKRAKDGTIQRALETNSGLEVHNLVTKKNTYWVSFLNSPLFKLRKGNTGYRVCSYVGTGYGAQAFLNFDFDDIGIAAGFGYFKNSIKHHYFFENSNNYIDFSEVNEMSHFTIPVVVKFPIEGDGYEGFEIQRFLYLGLQLNKNYEMQQIQYIDQDKTSRVVSVESGEFQKYNYEFLAGLNIANIGLQLSFMPGHFLNSKFEDEYGLNPYKNQRKGPKVFFSFNSTYAFKPTSMKNIKILKEKTKNYLKDNYPEISLRYSIHTFFNVNYNNASCQSIFTTLPFINSSIDLDFGSYYFGGGISLEHSNFGIATKRGQFINRNSVYSFGTPLRLRVLDFYVGATYYYNYHIKRRKYVQFSEESEKFVSSTSKEKKKFTLDYFVGVGGQGAIQIELHYMPENILDKFYSDTNGFRPHEFAQDKIIYIKLKRTILPRSND